MNATAAGRNLSAWLGPPLAIVGVLSYFTYFYWWPLLRDFPWLNYTLLVLALALSVQGLRNAWPRAGVRRIAAALGLLLCTASSSLFIWYVNVRSEGLPDARGGLALGASLPDLTLVSHDGVRLDLDRISAPLVLVFYRGFW
jgi:hypothetical protein